MTSSWREPADANVFVDVETAGLELSCSILQVAAAAVDSQLREVDCFEAKLRFDIRRIRPEHRRKCLAYRKRWRKQLRHPRDVATGLARFFARHATMDMTLAGHATCRVAQLVLTTRPTMARF